MAMRAEIARAALANLGQGGGRWSKIEVHRKEARDAIWVLLWPSCLSMRRKEKRGVALFAGLPQRLAELTTRPKDPCSPQSKQLLPPVIDSAVDLRIDG